MPEPIVTLNEESLRSDLRELVRKTVEDTLNGLLEAEADELVGAERYERTAEREAYRTGHYDRGLTTSSGEVTIHMPKLKGARFTTAIIERYRRRESSVEEAMIEMYLAGVSTRRIEDVSEILWGSSVSAATVSNLNEKAFASVEEWRNRPLERAYPYVYVDGIYLKRSWGGAYENVAVMVAVGVNDDGYREVIGAAEGFTESSECWRDFLSWLRSRGLRGVRMIVGDKAAGMVGSIAEVFPDAAYQRCTVHFYRNVLAVSVNVFFTVFANVLAPIPPTHIHRLRQRTFTTSGWLAPSFPSSSPIDTSFSLYDLPVILTSVQWWHRRSAIALAVTLLPKTSPHLPTGTFVVTMVERPSTYLLFTSWNSRSAPSFPMSRCPSSSMMSRLQRS